MAQTITDFTSLNDIQRYLGLLFPDPPDDAWLVISWLASPGDFRSQWFLVADMPEAAQRLLTLSKACNTYVGLGLRHPRCTPTPASRGTSEDVFALGGLWCELDHSGGVHSATNLPTPKQLAAFLKQLPFQLSVTIDSGGGVHGYLLFKELWILETPEEQASAATLLRRFQRTLQVKMTAKRWKMDSTADLARVLRPTGTLNHKGATPKPVLLIDANAQRYNPSDLQDVPWLAVLDDMYVPPAGAGAFPTTLLAPIETGCAWMAHCRNEAPTLPEPEWYAMLGIVGRCEQGHDLAHEWSATYPGYSAKETDKKLEHALEDAGPRTCQKIRYDLDGEAYCRACPSWGKIKSPIKLGMPVAADLDLGTPVGFQGRNGHKPATAPVTSTQTTKDPEEETAWYQEDIQQYVSKKGIVDANDTTICGFLRNHSYWQGKLWWDDLANKPMHGDEELSDYLITKIGAFFGKKHKLPIRTDRMLTRCLTACCYEHKRDPLQEYLDTLVGWDGTPRLEQWFIECAGLVDTAYNRFVSRILPVSMIARAYDPGCLYRNVIVLEGPEEYRKSSFVAALVPNKRWHLSMTASFESKDVPMLIQGIWVAELSELDSLRHTAETRLKSFISETEDAYVPKWQIFRVAPKRRTIFVGTTNEHNWMKSTGNTRWWPVEIRYPMDIEQLFFVREQLYAEAKLWYHDHRQDWWEIPPDVQQQAGKEREERRQASVYEVDLGRWLDYGRFQLAQQSPSITPIVNETSWAEIASGFLRLDSPEKWKDMQLQRQIGEALKALGWRQKVTTRNDKRVRLWCYEPPAPF